MGNEKSTKIFLKFQKQFVRHFYNFFPEISFFKLEKLLKIVFFLRNVRREKKRRETLEHHPATPNGMDRKFCFSTKLLFSGTVITFES